MLNTSFQIMLKFLLLLGFLLSGGCATTAHHPNPDPFEKFNRGVFAFNEGIDKTLLKPVAETYQAIVPDPVDEGVTNFFSNLDDIVVIANDLLQLKLKQATSDIGRLFLNSTIGILGVVDVATEVGLSKHSEDFGQTLGYWGVGSGPYLVLPFFGPSSVRDVVGRGVDILLDPRVYYANLQGTDARNFVIATNVLKGIDTRADLIGTEKILQAAALDDYSYLRDAYLARREYLVYDGNPPQTEEEEEFDEEDLFEDLEEDNEAEGNEAEMTDVSNDSANTN